MSLHDRVPVEPLAPERLERLEQRIVAASAPALARPARHALWPWGLALASAAAAALAVFALRPLPRPPAAPPVAVSTDARGATLDLGEVVIVASADTRFDVRRDGGGLDVRLDHGAVRLDVAPRHNRPPLWVHAGDVGVRVVGTAFTVTRAPGAGEVEVEVEHGTVEVHRNGTIAAVTGGQRWSSRDGAVLAVVAGDPVIAATGAAAAGGAGSGAGAGRIGAAGSHTADLATGPAIDVAVLTDRRPGTPLTGVPTPRNPDVPTTGVRTPRDRSTPAPAAPVVDVDPVADLHRAISAQRLAPAMSVIGETAEARAASLRALAATSRGAEAAAALYGLARTQHVELGRPADALRSLDAYLTRFPRGAEIEAVMWLRLRVLCRGQVGDACRAAAHSYAKRDDSDEARRAIAVRVTNAQ